MDTPPGHAPRMNIVTGIDRSPNVQPTKNLAHYLTLTSDIYRTEDVPQSMLQPPDDQPTNKVSQSKKQTTKVQLAQNSKLKNDWVAEIIEEIKCSH